MAAPISCPACGSSASIRSLQDELCELMMKDSSTKLDLYWQHASSIQDCNFEICADCGTAYASNFEDVANVLREHIERIRRRLVLNLLIEES